MFETVIMRITGENEVDSLEETFLIIVEEYKSFIDKGLECIALNDSQKQLQKWKPIFMIFSINNSMSKRKQTTLSINSSSGQ